MPMLCTCCARAMMSGSRSACAGTPSRQHCRPTCSGAASPHTCTRAPGYRMKQRKSCPFHAVTLSVTVHPRLQP
eukprot:scaffold73597_cov69-Phaeocystis_antarctica.AAC.1